MMDRFDDCSRIVGDDKSDVVSFLHRAGERYKEHLQLLQRQQEEEQRRIAPGKPLVSPFANDWYQQTTRKGEAVEERLHKLHQKRKEKENAARERAQHERDEKEMKEVRSTLEITEMAKSHPARNPAAVTEKFLADHRKNLQRLAEEAIGRELKDVQAAPKVTALALTPKTLSRKQGKHIEDHLIAVEQERRLKLFQKVEAKKIIPQDHFKPQITQRARSLQPVGSVVERLYTRNNHPAPAYDETFERECTFRPATNKTSVAEYQDPYASVVVFDRLHENLPRSMAAMSQQSVARERRHQEETTAELTFTPRISKTSSQIVEKKRQESTSELLCLSPTSRLYRQGTHDKTCGSNTPANSDEGSNRRSRHAEESVVQSGDEQDGKQPNKPFTPNINERSREIWKKLVRDVVEVNKDNNEQQPFQRAAAKQEAKSARELLWEKKQHEKKRYLLELKEKLLEREVAECTFAPQYGGVAANSHRQNTSTASFYPADFADRENMWVQQRDRNLEEMKHEKEKSQLEGCTFQPTIHKEVPYGAAFVANAAGFERHVQRLNTVRQQKEAERQKKPAHPFKAALTVAVPFVLGKERQERERMRRNVRDSDDEGIAALRPPINYDEWSQIRAGLEDDAGASQARANYHYGRDTERQAFAPENTRRGDRDGSQRYYSDEPDEAEGDNETTFYVHRPNGSGTTPREREGLRDNANFTNGGFSGVRVSEGRRQGRLEYNTTSPVDYIINNHQSILRHAR